MNYLRYRIATIDDFTDTLIFVDYQLYGSQQAETWDVCKTGRTHKGYNATDDAIHVFLNFKKMGVFKSRQEAIVLVIELLQNAPINLMEYREMWE